MISATFGGTDVRVVQRLQEKGPKVIAALMGAIDESSVRLQSHIVSDKLQGQVLHMRKGNLVRSVRVIAVVNMGQSLVGGVQGGGGVAWYGRVHEYGGVFTYLRKNARRAFSTVVTATFPVRSFMRSSLSDQQASIMQRIREAGQQTFAE